MMHDDDQLLRGVRAALDQGADTISPDTRARLEAARSTALEYHTASRPQRAVVSQRWLLAGGGAAAAAALLTVLVWHQPHAELPIAELDQLMDLEMATSIGDLELMQDMDFYRWLEATHAQAP